MTMRRSTSQLFAGFLFVACGLFTSACPKQRDGGASLQPAASASSATRAAQDDERADDKASDQDDEDEAEDGRRVRGGW